MDYKNKEDMLARLEKRMQQYMVNLDNTMVSDNSFTSDMTLIKEQYKTLNDKFCEKIKKTRLERNMSISQFAVAAQIDPFILYKIENQKMDIKITTAMKLSKILGIKENSILF